MASITLDSATNISQDSAEIEGSYDCDDNEEIVSISLVSPSAAECDIDEYGSNSFIATITDLEPGSKETIEISLNYKYKTDTSDKKSDSTTDSIVIYTKPNNFYFNFKGPLDKAGTISWNISEGIQTVLPGLYNSTKKESPFNIEATKWKKWKKQTGKGIQDCVAFSAGDLSAEMVNNAYKYLGASNEAIYKPGDAVSKQIFLGLEQIMNE